MHNLFHFLVLFSRVVERVEMKMFYGLDMQCIIAAAAVEVTKD